MEGKTVISSLLIMSLFLTQIQVEAKKLCCPNHTARSKYLLCIRRPSPEHCLALSTCKIISGNICPPGYTNDIHENSGDAVKEYCELGCASSVCGTALTTLQNLDASKDLSEAVELCTKVCSTVCTGGPSAAVKSA
ncbi:Thionin [Arabidopsis thaliana x Arabidopsis arenosa]|uniref:Thionin n=1 Tax=Arabidopsis thaliana x Arabidopsis arenosa TaxID=1240361 RepID=A0A8T1Y9T1_9BRAS|nr:Thionin [Arabidopsis thaliana x Arabidopsis arenosa]